MGAILVPLIVLAVILVVAVIGIRSWAGRRNAVADDLAERRTPTLDYVVPPGQDPVVLLTALSADGYSATEDPRRTDLVHISCPAGLDRDRARVRATIQAVHTTAVETGAPIESGPVKFVDEQ
ncbi:hypothetical protein [Nocardioides sp. YIM 152315]|uniref:hypothetical protein n=1 Tax=Nocardioides sp. YIM 152315 TaxID=3031760 RepID=UPI0023DA5DA6|nr:hypothetical protein [Nocardioides sp. YIM 152315]MDF1606244.1 hypothetical protein [Nocardioides sp. YIM 152315]